jgi:DNA repair protein RecO (recombination protein O)
MLIQEKLFILKKTRFGEADLILQALRPNGARVGLFARSAMRSRKRFGGGALEPTHFVLALYDERRERGGESVLFPLREASLLNGFARLRSDYSRLEAALRFVRLACDVSREGDVGSGELFNLLGNALSAAETTASLEKLRIHFEARVLAAQGVLPREREEAVLLRAPVSEHERAPLAESEWRDVSGRVHSAMRAYLSHLRPDRAP